MKMTEHRRGAGAGSLRRHNLALLLGMVCRSAPVSRVRLAEAAGLTKATVSSLVAELVDASFLHDAGSVAATGPGRPAGMLVPSPLAPVAIGLQIEADHLAGCLMDIGGRVRARELRRYPVAGAAPADAIRAARPLLARLFEQALAAGTLVAGVAVAVPGRVDRDADGDATVGAAPGLGWRNVDVCRLVARELTALGAHGVDVGVDNDVAFASLAEYYSTTDFGRSCDLYVGGESGVDVALVLDGMLGRAVAGGGFGHVPIRRRGPRCVCGARGCLDVYAGRAAMVDSAGMEGVARTRPGSGGRRPAEPADVGGRAARQAIATAAEALGDALTPLVGLTHPAGVVLGGRLAAFGGELLRPLRTQLVRVTPATTFRVTALGPDAAMRGAAGTVTDRLIADPAAWFEDARRG